MSKCPWDFLEACHKLVKSAGLGCNMKKNQLSSYVVFFADMFFIVIAMSVIQEWLIGAHVLLIIQSICYDNGVI